LVLNEKKRLYFKVMRVIHPRTYVEDQLLKLKPVKYNRYQWWRNWKIPDELHSYAPTLEKIRNGDFDYSPYYWMAQYALYEFQDKIFGIKDLEKKREVESLYMEKYRRLMEDYHKDEHKRLDNLKRELRRCFGLTKELVDEYLKSFEGTLEELYNLLTRKYTAHRIKPPKFNTL
jgi:hypothetical protein